MRVWKTENGQPVGSPLGGNRDDVTAVAMAEGGQRIMASIGDGSLAVWPGPKAWRDELCSKLTAPMTHTEWHDWVTLDDDQYVAPCPGLPVPQTAAAAQPAHH